MHFVFYTDWFIQEKFAGQTYGPFIFIRPSSINDIGLLEHEKVHTKQFWRTFGLFGFAYLLSKRKRLQYEVEAFKEQLKYAAHPGAAKLLFADYLSKNYKLDISVQDALKHFE
jgi:hypothetical protein